MRLASLSPRWVVGNYRDESNMEWQPGDCGPGHPARNGMGISFECPIHGDGHRLVVCFSNPVDGGPPVQEGKLWQRTGNTFDTLTLTPSVDASHYLHLSCNGSEHGTTCWHGHVSDGNVTP